MGAVAFIMAETIDVPYAEIVEAAIIPASSISPPATSRCISRPASAAARPAEERAAERLEPRCGRTGS